MFDRIILLTSPVEQTALSALLLGHNPQLTICPAATPEDLAALDAGALSSSRLIAFSSPVIVPREPDDASDQDGVIAGIVHRLGDALEDCERIGKRRRPEFGRAKRDAIEAVVALFRQP